MVAIDAKNLVKIYGKSTKSALNDVSLRIAKGSFFALLGPNGAGKSTFINILAGTVIPTAGQVHISGYDIHKQMRQARMAVGIVPQELNLDPFFTPLQLLEIQAGLYGVPTSKRRSMEILDLVGLSDKANAYARALSGGMLRRLLMAKAMVHDPDILILDEPTAGVDVELRHMLWEQMKILNQAGKTIMLTTHYLEEAQALCNEIAIINNGSVVMQDTKENLFNTLGNQELVLTLQEDTIQAQHLHNELAAFFPEEKDKQWIFRYRTGAHTSGKIIHLLIHLGYTILSIQSRETQLEDIFLQLTQQPSSA